jgi:hypothetical protein
MDKDRELNIYDIRNRFLDGSIYSLDIKNTYPHAYPILDIFFLKKILGYIKIKRSSDILVYGQVD